ncbi:MAG: T9SS type A sorting domain-containing protein [Bacteroidota bacterium]
MNSIKSYFAIITLMLLTVSLSAQPKAGKRSQKGQQSIENLKSELNLTDEQVSQFESISEQFKADAKALKTDESLSLEEKKEAFSTLRAEREAAIVTILTMDQIQKLETLKEERQALRQEKKEEARKYFQSIDREGMKAEMKAYKSENIKPVILEQRQKLELEISLQDKQEIARLRESAKAVKQEMKAKKAEFKAERQKGQKPGPEMREAMQRIAEPYKADLESAKAIAAKYDAEITALLEEMEDDKEAWKSDMKSIRDKYTPDEKPEGLGKTRKRGQHGKKGQANSEREKMFDDHEQKRKVKFLLMDPSAETATTLAPDPKLDNLTVYPNPALSNTKLEYEVLTAGNVLVELQNQQGQVLRTLLNQYQDAGKYTLDVDLSNVRGNVFYYVVKNQNSILSQKVIKANR